MRIRRHDSHGGDVILAEELTAEEAAQILVLLLEHGLDVYIEGGS